MFNVSFQFAISHGMLSLAISKGKSFLLQIFGYETCSTVAGTVFFIIFLVVNFPKQYVHPLIPFCQRKIPSCDNC